MTDLILNNRAYNSEEVFNTCFVEPLKEAGKTITYNEIHKGYIQSLATLGALVQLTGTPPTIKELEEITKAHGGTIIDIEAKRGVVDTNLKLHNIDNIYISGASVFPSSSIYNPTYTIIAMGLRLSKYILSRST